jgi:hypothetical protein
MAITITTLAQTVQLDDIGDIVVTTTEQDPDVGDYVREMRIFGEPLTEGGTAPLIYTLRLRATMRQKLDITAPASNF